jgi:uncharacterized protein
MKKYQLMFTLLCVSFIAKAEQLEADTYYQQAIVLYEQGKQTAFPLLKKAANSGNTDAMCLLGFASSDSVFIKGKESENWFRNALKHEAPCGYMAFLESNAISETISGSPDKNLENEFIKKITPKAESKDIKAIKMLSYYYGTRGNAEKEQYWAEKAAELGDADMMRTIAGMIKDGDWGWYILPSSKEKAVKEWMLKSAEHGNPRAMGWMALEERDNDNFKEMLSWIEKEMSIGDANAIAWLGQLYSNYHYSELKEKSLPESLLNKPRGYACYYILQSQLSPTHILYSIAKEQVDSLLHSHAYSDDDIKKGQQIAEEWMKTHQVRDWSVEFGVL